MPLEPLGDRPRGCGWLFVDPRAFLGRTRAAGGGCWLTGLGATLVVAGVTVAGRLHDEVLTRVVFTAAGLVVGLGLIGLHGSLLRRDDALLERRRWLVERGARAAEALARLEGEPRAAALGETLERGTEDERLAVVLEVRRLLSDRGLDPG